MDKDTAFEMATSNIRYGRGVTAEVGMDLVDMGVENVMVVTDGVLASLPPVTNLLAALEDSGVRFQLFDRVRVEPTDRSFKEAIDFAAAGGFDGFVAVGGGSTIDTAKAANLYDSHPADFLDYVNAPIGKGLPAPGPLKPLIAVPTTCGNRQRNHGGGDFRLHRDEGEDRHRPPPPETGAGCRRSGEHPHPAPGGGRLDRPRRVLSHALESYTAIPFDERPRPERPVLRPLLPGRQPDQRHMGPRVAGDGSGVPSQGGRRPRG